MITKIKISPVKTEQIAPNTSYNLTSIKCKHTETTPPIKIHIEYKYL